MMTQSSQPAILVTGGAGFIGSHTCKVLSQSGWLPIAFDNLSRGHRDAVQFGPFFEGDLLDPASLDAAFQKHRPVGVLHFGALAYVGESVGNPALYYRNNFVGSLNLVEAMIKNGCKKLVFSSTCAVYGIPERVPMTETAPKNPVNPYGQSKRMVEDLLEDFGRAHGLSSVALRYFNAAGADPDGVLSERHSPETHLIPSCFEAQLGKRPKLQVFGQDYPTPDGTCVRDYVHVLDLAQAHLLAMELLQKDPSPGMRAFNLGTGNGYSVREVIQAVEKVTGKPVPHENGPRRAGDPPKLVADPKLARQELGWSPTRSDLETQVRDAWRAFRK